MQNSSAAKQLPFDQISISDLPQVDPSSKVYAKLDWLSVMFQDCTFNTILHFLKLDDCLSDFCLNWFERTKGLDDAIVFNFQGVQLEAKKVFLYGFDINELVFDVCVPHIRLDISGQGLDFLRSRGINCEQYFRNPDNYPGERLLWHLTRIDFAFDFINYAGDLCDQLIRHINEQKTPSDRIVLYGDSPIKYRMALGGQKTIYLGSPQSERQLRVYDKKLQYIDQRTGFYVKDNPYDNPESWIRIELQLRKKAANEIGLALDHDMTSVLKYIYTKYTFAEGTNAYNRIPAKWWSELLNWDVLPQIIQNFDEVQFVDPKDRAVTSFFAFHFKAFIKAYSILGASNFFKVCDRVMLKLNDTSDPLSRKRLKNLMVECSLIDVDINQYSDGLYDANPFGTVPSLGFRMKGSDQV